MRVARGGLRSPVHAAAPKVTATVPIHTLPSTGSGVVGTMTVLILAMGMALATVASALMIRNTRRTRS